jgi:hypothetical protein
MKRLVPKTLLATVVCLSLAPPASAADEKMLYASDAIGLAEVLRAEGYRAKPGKDSDGDPKISSGIEGHNFSIYFYGCTRGATAKVSSFRRDGTSTRVFH